jgi:hypothetical protein
VLLVLNSEAVMNKGFRIDHVLRGKRNDEELPHHLPSDVFFREHNKGVMCEIETLNGYKKITDITRIDNVKALQITDKFSGGNIIIGITQLISTRNRGVVRAIELMESDILLGFSEKYFKLHIEELKDPISTFYINVENNEDYFLGPFILRGV